MVPVAEDHQINVILAVLEAAGCETELAANGRQALAKLDKADFDLIIMDSQMPVERMLRRNWEASVYGAGLECSL
jgi:CheY-like chemotaxis protein